MKEEVVEAHEESWPLVTPEEQRKFRRAYAEALMSSQARGSADPPPRPRVDARGPRADAPVPPATHADARGPRADAPVPPPPRPHADARGPRADRPRAVARGAHGPPHGFVVPKAPVYQDSRRITTQLICQTPGCQLMREAVVCNFCACHCDWHWPTADQPLCKVHWDQPLRCKTVTMFCKHNHPTPDKSDCTMCRQHCTRGADCAYHSQAAKPSSNRSRGLRSSWNYAKKMG